MEKKEFGWRWSEYIGELFSDEREDLEDQIEDDESLEFGNSGERRETRNEGHEER